MLTSLTKSALGLALGFALISPAAAVPAHTTDNSDRKLHIRQ